jgi:4-carboxymuconolactone decarboxylase
MEPSELAEGRTRRSRAQGAKHESLQAALGSLDPRLADWADGWIFGQVWDDEAEFQDRMLVAIVALAATNKPGQLKNYLHGALQDGMDPRRIHEALVMLVVYVGFPTALQAMVVWQEVVSAARKRGMDVDVPVTSTL